MEKERNSRSDLWIKMLMGLIIALFLAGFGYLEKKKVDTNVFSLNRENQQQQFKRIEQTMIRIERKIDGTHFTKDKN